MNNVLTLAVNSEVADLDTNHVLAAIDALASAGADVGSTNWLADKIACDIPFSGLNHVQAGKLIRSELTKVDVFSQPITKRRKTLLLADMDATIVTCETLDELADFAGKKEEIVEKTSEENIAVKCFIKKTIPIIR